MNKYIKKHFNLKLELVNIISNESDESRSLGYESWTVNLLVFYSVLGL